MEWKPRPPLHATISNHQLPYPNGTVVSRGTGFYIATTDGPVLGCQHVCVLTPNTCIVLLNSLSYSTRAGQRTKGDVQDVLLGILNG